MHPIHLNSLKQFLMSEGFNFICCIDSKGDRIANYNVAKDKINEKATEIVKALNSKVFSDGIYYIEYKSTANGNKKKFPIQKGDSIVESDTITINKQEAFAESAMNIDEIIQLKTDLVRLEIENENLKQKVEDLEFISEDDNDDNDESGSNNISTILTIASPIIEKYFSLEEKKIEAMYASLPTSMSEKQIVKDPRIAQIEMEIKSAKREDIAVMYNNAISNNIEREFIQMLFMCRINDAIEIYNFLKND